MTTPTLPKSWAERLAIINEFKVPNERAVELFGTSERELQTARRMVQNGVMVIGSLSTEDRAKWAPVFASDSQPATTVVTPIISNPVAQTAPTVIQSTNTIATPTVSATTTAKPRSRGRQGSKIATAFQNLTSTPVPLDVFTKQYGISQTVLRQSRRFLDEPITVSIKRDPVTKQVMVCRK